MPRPRRDGAPARAPRKQKFTELSVRKLKSEPAAYMVWDSYQRGLAIRVQPTGRAAWKVIYHHHGRPRWYHIGDVDAIGLADARKLAAKTLLEVATGKDPAAEKRAERGAGAFAELAERYVELHAKKWNKSWRQADTLVRRYLFPRWGRLQAASIARADVRAMIAGIEAPVLANQTLAAASAIFSWAVKMEIVAVNPCSGVERNATKDRERILSDSELPLFWSAFDSAGLVASSALKVLLLTGQRPGEVTHMRREHLVDGWWEMAGEPVPALNWPGTKNGASHRVWLPAPVQKILAELDGTGFVFAGERGGGVKRLDAAMRDICSRLGSERATPHDLRRTFSTKVTALGFGRDGLNRVTNHKEGGIASVYDRHGYADENRRIMETVAANIMSLAEGRPDDKVVPLPRKAKT
jgi:integrase